MQVRAFVFGTRTGDIHRLGRTLRSLKAAGIAGKPLLKLDSQSLHEILKSEKPVLFLRAGTWLAKPEGFQPPHPSATGKGLCAFGAVQAPHESEPATQSLAVAWQKLLARSGGDLAMLAHADFPHSSVSERSAAPSSLFAAFYLDSRAVRTLMERGANSLGEIVRLAHEEFRFVHFPSLDVCDDNGFRVLQLITALHRGGAERVALDLMKELPGQEVRVRLATTGRPLRDAFAAPAGTLELAGISRSAEERAAALLREATAFGADLVHGHLINREDARRISGGGFPLLLTVHNMRPGWPRGLADLQASDATLLAACAQAVEREVVAAKLPLPVRTARNGIDLHAFQPTPDRVAAGKKWRQTWGFGDEDFVMLSVANPRPQKRLHLLPAILASVRAGLGPGRQARLVLCGEALAGNTDAERSVRETQAEVARLALEQHIRWTGSVANVSEIFAAADALVSTSAHEGLSLAQLEALAMSLPVAATDVGGAREIARDNPRVHLLPPDATPEQFAQELVPLACAHHSESALRQSLRHWSRGEMAARYRWLYPRAIAAFQNAGPGNGIWLIANNFSTGGAQSSARRLLAGLAAQGVRVRAAVVEENPEYPTPGRAALQAANIPVVAASPALKTTVAVEHLLEAMDGDRPRAVVFWNLRPSFKVLLADALLGVPVFDVSPGEMFFDSLEKYFAEQRSSLPYRNARDYGARLAGVIVKYRAEAQRAAQILGAPVHVIPNGVPLADRPSERWSQLEPPTHTAIVTAARINPQKRLEDLIEAFQLAHPRLPDYTLRIAGGVERGCDEYAASLRSQANGLPIEWVGEVRDVTNFHRQSDLFVMISEPAGCPNASLEAMAAGLPIIATDVGGASEQVIDRRTGRLVPPRDPHALAEALVELATQPELRKSMGAAAHSHIRDQFAVERMVADYRRVFLPDDERVS